MGSHNRGDDSTDSPDDRDDPQRVDGTDLLGSGLFSGAAESLVGVGARMLGGDPTATQEDLRAETDRMMERSGIPPEQRQSLVDAAVAGGLALGASRSNIREAFAARSQARQSPEFDGEVDGPLMQAREIEQADGSFGGVRVFVDVPAASVDVYRGDRSLLVRTPHGEEEVALGFVPGNIEWADDTSEEGIAEFVVRRRTKVDEFNEGLKAGAEYARTTDDDATDEEEPADDADPTDDDADPTDDDADPTDE